MPRKSCFVFQSLFECTSITLGCNALYDESQARSYFKHWLVICFEKDIKGGVSFGF